ncbi:MAG: energy transducer TonB [Caldimicrobium sp.]|nr:energy transducer TonB [Caldimicrobium sp.]MCX7874212.1 energy transducer TonB [Caldimicrobium sp.]MDW8094616.1 energy transducer TonB [Caldimicrobium sp.]
MLRFDYLALSLFWHLILYLPLLIILNLHFHPESTPLEIDLSHISLVRDEQSQVQVQPKVKPDHKVTTIMEKITESQIQSDQREDEKPKSNPKEETASPQVPTSILESSKVKTTAPLETERSSHSEAKLSSNPEIKTSSLSESKTTLSMEGAFNTPSEPTLLVKTLEAKTQGASKSTSHQEEASSLATLGETYLKAKFSVISDIIKRHLSYPPLARKMGWQGNLIISFTLTPKGEIKDIKVEKSSGYELLDRNTLEVLKKTYSYFPLPPVEVRVRLPVVYKLE